MTLLEGGHIVVRVLKEEGVQFVAGIPGGSMFEIVAGLADTPAVRPILTRHERVAVDIADGYARVSGRPGVSASVKGPGDINAMSGLSHSYADSVPVLHLAGQVEQRLIGKNVFQENNVLEMSQSITKWNARANSIDRIPEILRRAFMQLASGRPRPVLVELPQDVLKDTMPESDFHYEPVLGHGSMRTRPDPIVVEHAVKEILLSERPVIYAGAGVLISDAAPELLRLAETIEAPVTTTLNAKSAFPENHPLSLGIGGFPQSIYSTRQAAEFTRRADLVIAIGNSFKQEATRGLGKPAGVKLIHVDVDPFEIHKEQFADVAVVGDAKLVLADLVAALGTEVKAAGRSWVREEIKRLRAETLSEWMPHYRSDRTPINPYRVLWDFMSVTDPAETIVLHDSGNTRGYIAHGYVATHVKGFIGMGGQSNLGYSLGGSIGAKLAAPEKLVVNFMGDGALGFTGMDIETASRESIPILTVLLNNGSHGSWVPYEEKYPDKELVWMFFGGDYAAMARSLGAYAERVEHPSELVPKLQTAIRATKEGRPALVEVITDRNILPPYIPNPVTYPDGPWAPSL